MRNYLFGACVAACIELALSLPAAATTYDFNLHLDLNGSAIVGYIKTDCNLCTVTTSDITDWFLEVTAPQVHFITSPGVGPVFASEIHANHFEIQFDFDSHNNGEIAFFPIPFDELCFSDASRLCSPNQTTAGIMIRSVHGTDIIEHFYSMSGLMQIAVAEPVPEASTWAMMLIGFAGIGFLAHRRKKGARRLA